MWEFMTHLTINMSNQVKSMRFIIHMGVDSMVKRKIDMQFYHCFLLEVLQMWVDSKVKGPYYKMQMKE